MKNDDFQHIKLSMLDDVVLVEIMSKDLVGPELAQELGAELTRMTDQDLSRRVLVDFSRTTHLSSTGFAVLVGLVNRTKKAGRQIIFCNMDDDVRVGADIIGLSRLVEFHDSQKEALKAFAPA